ncbi:MAG: tetratricopeptide repeat protein [Candidatus Peregrinibacteria bacterium]|nr:tetratricopeptide repeat protein [Candidatus Peregrinibacteria bacterium]MDZ4244765.1 tetratricopeptide repeat protein [Candidatus Gracilibacteria bacterium]
MAILVQNLIEEADKKKLNGQHKEAIDICEHILYEDLACVEAYEEIGDNYLSLRKFDRAMKALQRAINIDPMSPNAHYLLGFTHSALSNWNISVDHLETADYLQPNHPEILRCLGWSVFHAGNRKKGLILLERALTISPDDPLVLCDLAICYLNDKNFDRSIALLRESLMIDPDNEKTKECLKTALFFKSEYDKIEQDKDKRS